MVFVRKFLAVLIILIFIPLLMISILVFGLKTTLLNPLYLQTNFSQSNFYEKILDTGLPILAESLNKENQEGNQIDENIQVDDLVAIAQKSISPAWLQSQFDNLFEEFNDYLIGKSNEIDFTISLKDLKTSLRENFNQYTLDKISQTSNQKLNDDQIDELLKQFPDEYDLGKILMQTQGPTLTAARTFFSYLKLGIIALAGINILLLILIGLLIWKPAASLLKWLATAIIIPSAILSILAGFSYFSSPLVGNLGLNLPGELKNLVSTIIVGLIQPAILKMLLITGAGVILAIIAYIIAHIISKKHPVDKPTNKS